MKNSSTIDYFLTWLARVVFSGGLVLSLLYEEHLQRVVDATYKFLLSTWVFNSVYFETWWATAVYPIILLVPLSINKLTFFDRYKLNPKVTYQDAGVCGAILEGLEYAAPLMLLDTFTTKRYGGTGIDPREWDTRRANWIQTTRALPQHPPTVRQIAIHLVLSLIAYDFLFCMVHFTLHKSMWLYRHLHAKHHDHAAIHSRVTNQLTVVERIMLVLSANQALKFFHSHPLTRAIFVPLFLAWLTENHCGYDFPWTLNRVVPGGVIGGSPAHFAHHMQGHRHYQPFFTYIDKFINKFSKNKNV